MITKNCEICGKEMNLFPSQSARRFCSKKCKGKAQSEIQKGENNPFWHGGLYEIICATCGNHFYVYRSAKERGIKYCSEKCRGIAFSGKNNPSWNGGKVSRTCLYCGKKFNINRYGAKHGGRFCSKECQNIGNRGETSPLYMGGRLASRKRTEKRLSRIPKYVISRRINNGIWRSLRKNKNYRMWSTLVGYNKDDLFEHLNKSMPKGYTWQDFIDGKLHIDHIIPISVFNFSSPEHIDFKKCWALSNLQLLPAKENIAKKNKLKKPFQPSFEL